MEQFLEKFTGEIAAWIAKVLTWFIGLLLSTSALLGCRLLLLQTDPADRLNETTLLAALLLVSIILLLSYIAYLHLRQRLVFRFGVLWDHRRQPYCPVHRVGLRNPGDWTARNEGFGLECRLCFWEGAGIENEAKSQKYIRLVDDSGKDITLEEAYEHCKDGGRYISKKP